MQYAFRPRSKKKPVLGNEQGNSEISAVTRQAGRIFRPCGGVARQDVSAAAAVAATSNEDDDFAAWAPYR